MYPFSSEPSRRFVIMLPPQTPFVGVSASASRIDKEKVVAKGAPSLSVTRKSIVNGSLGISPSVFPSTSEMVFFCLGEMKNRRSAWIRPSVSNSVTWFTPSGSFPFSISCMVVRPPCQSTSLNMRTLPRHMTVIPRAFVQSVPSLRASCI